MDSGVPPGNNFFGTTRWSIVLQAKGARGGDQPTKAQEQRREALGKLIETYWRPLYFFIRRKGYSAVEAEDLAQSFFAAFLEKDFLKSVERGRGRFRSFLLVALDHFLANEYDKARALKRGGQHTIVSLDYAEAEKRYAAEPVTHESPERVYLRKWARQLTDQAMSGLAAEFENRGKKAQFATLKAHLAGGEDYAAVAESLEMSVSHVKVTVHRARARYREILRELVRDTVATDAEVDDELWELIRAL
jgi:RNA polymerase sigma factor (sigma-70 family)